MTNPLSNQRKCRCLDCAATIQPGKGHAVATSSYVCDACRKIRQAQTEAWRYSQQILVRVTNPEDRWLVSSMLSSLVLRAGEKAPLIMQAVSDRVGWLDLVTYALATDIARQETRQLGLTFQVA